MANKVGAFEAPATAFTGYTPPTPALIRNSKAAWAIHEFAGGAAEMAKNPSVASWNEVFLTAFESGVTNFEIADGIYPFRDVIGPNAHPTEIIRDGQYTVRAGRGANLIVGAELTGEVGAMLRFLGTTNPRTDPLDENRNFLHWIGGTFSTEMTVAARFGIVFFDISYFDWQIEGALFNGGLQAPAAGDINANIGTGFMDTAIGDHQCVRGVSRFNEFWGFVDAAEYHNGPGVSVGDAITRVGHYKSLYNLYYRCRKGVILKRSHVNTEVAGSTFIECATGIQTAPITVQENRGERFNIHHNVFKRMQEYGVWVGGESCNVHDNEFEDWSHNLFDDSIYYPTSGEAPFAAIRCEGTPKWLVHDNHARMVDWAGTDWSSQTSRAPAFLTVRNQDNDSISDVAANYGHAHHNQVTDVHRVYHERSSGVTDYNVFENREMCTGETYTDVIVGPNTQVLTGTSYGREFETLVDAAAARAALDLTSVATMSTTLTLGSFNGTDTDIVSLVGGTSGSGALITGQTNGHLVVALEDNDGTDSFSIISGSGDYSSDSTYDKLVARFRASGQIQLNGTDLTTFGYTIMGAADQAAGRTAMGLGTAAVANTSNADAANSIPIRDGSGWLSQRIIRNATGPTLDGMYIGFGNAGSGATRLYGGGDTTTPVYVTSGGNLNIPGGIDFENGTSNIINWGTAGVAAPSFTTRSAGTKLVLYPYVGASSVDYGFGIDSGTLWSSVPSTAEQWKWYSGTTLAATLSGAGALTINTLALTNDLAVSDGGTGVSTLTGIVKGNGTSAFSAAVAGTDYMTPANVAATYAPLASPALTGSPTAPTQTAEDNSTKIATTAYVDTLASRPPTAQTTALTLTSAQSGKMYTNAAATARVDFTLPPAVAGLEYEFLVVDTDGIRITADSGSGDNIRNGTATTGGYIESTTIGSYIKLKAINTTSWYAVPSLGTWTLV